MKSLQQVHEHSTKRSKPHLASLIAWTAFSFPEIFFSCTSTALLYHSYQINHPSPLLFMTNEDTNDPNAQASFFTTHPSAYTIEQIKSTTPCAKIRGEKLSKFNAEQDLGLVREVATAQARIAKHSKTQTRFKIAAEKRTNSDFLTKPCLVKTFRIGISVQKAIMISTIEGNLTNRDLELERCQRLTKCCRKWDKPCKTCKW